MTEATINITSTHHIPVGNGILATRKFLKTTTEMTHVPMVHLRPNTKQTTMSNQRRELPFLRRGRRQRDRCDRLRDAVERIVGVGDVSRYDCSRIEDSYRLESANGDEYMT